MNGENRLVGVFDAHIVYFLSSVRKSCNLFVTPVTNVFLYDRDTQLKAQNAFIKAKPAPTYF